MKKFIIFCLSVFLSILISSTAPIWADAKLSDIQNALGRTLDNWLMVPAKGILKLSDGCPVTTCLKRSLPRSPQRPTFLTKGSDLIKIGIIQ